jgi:16S rRNA processing protein RimM
MELEGLNDRDLALAFKSYAVLMSREAFPKTDKDEYYWLDLIGIPVENTNGELLGKVIEMLDNSVQSVILIENDVKKQHLIPFIKEYVIEVDMVNKKPSRILVDWQLDW